MNIDDLTIAQAKTLASMFNPVPQNNHKGHPLLGRKVVAVLPHGFIHFGELYATQTGYKLTDASNLRYWSKRDGGLPEFAKKGPIADDRVDKIGVVYFDSALFFYPCGNWS